MEAKDQNAITQRDKAPLTAEQVTNMFGGSDVPQLPKDAPLPTISILRETPQFELPDGTTTKELVGHILYYHDANQYYKDKFGEGDAIPTCASSNAIRPDGGTEPGPYTQATDPQTGEAIIKRAPNLEYCDNCYLNQFGSKEGSNAKACTNTIRLYLLLDGDILPSVLKAPPSSLGKKSSLVKWLTNAPNVAAKAGMGTAYQTIKVKVLSKDDPEDEALLERLSAMYKDFKTNYFGRIAHDIATEEVDANVVEAEVTEPVNEDEEIPF